MNGCAARHVRIVPSPDDRPLINGPLLGNGSNPSAHRQGPTSIIVADPIMYSALGSRLAQPAASCLNLFGVSAVLVVAVPCSFRGATAVSATVHSTPSPPCDRRRLA